jgi:hypothetical protein
VVVVVVERVFVFEFVCGARVSARGSRLA